MAELAIPPLPSPIDPEKRREELAFLEGHDADIPTDDQTPGGLGVSSTRAPASQSTFMQPASVRTEKSFMGNDELGPESPAHEVNDKIAEANGSNERINTNQDESELNAQKNQDPEKRAGRVHDLEAGDKSSSTSKTEAELQVNEPPDPNIVWWDGPQDPENPLNWSEALKLGNVAVISMVTFITQVSHVCLLAR